MAMLEKHRNTIYTEFRKILGEEATQAMLSEFPVTDLEQPATKSDLALLGAELRREMAEQTNQLTNRMLTIAGLGLLAITLLLAAFS